MKRIILLLFFICISFSYAQNIGDKVEMGKILKIEYVYVKVGWNEGVKSYYKIKTDKHELEINEFYFKGERVNGFYLYKIYEVVLFGSPQWFYYTKDKK